MNFITTFEVQVSSHTIQLHCFFLLAGIIELLSISLLRFYNSREFSGMSERKVIQNEHIQGQDCADNRRYWRGSDSLKVSRRCLPQTKSSCTFREGSMLRQNSWGRIGRQNSSHCSASLSIQKSKKVKTGQVWNVPSLQQNSKAENWT